MIIAHIMRIALKSDEKTLNNALNLAAILNITKLCFRNQSRFNDKEYYEA